eukprot:UN05181
MDLTTTTDLKETSTSEINLLVMLDEHIENKIEEANPAYVIYVIFTLICIFVLLCICINYKVSKPKSKKGVDYEIKPVKRFHPSRQQKEKEPEIFTQYVQENEATDEESPVHSPRSGMDVIAEINASTAMGTCRNNEN